MLLEEAKGEPGPPPIQPFSWTFVIVLTLAAFATRFFKIRAGDFVL